MLTSFLNEDAFLTRRKIFYEVLLHLFSISVSSSAQGQLVVVTAAGVNHCTADIPIVSRSHCQSSEYRLPLLHFPEVGCNVVSEFVHLHFTHQPYQTSSPQKYNSKRMVTLSQTNRSGFRNAFIIPEQKHLLSSMQRQRRELFWSVSHTEKLCVIWVYTDYR